MKPIIPEEEEKNKEEERIRIKESKPYLDLSEIEKLDL